MHRSRAILSTTACALWAASTATGCMDPDGAHAPERETDAATTLQAEREDTELDSEDAGLDSEESGESGDADEPDAGEDTGDADEPEPDREDAFAADPPEGTTALTTTFGTRPLLVILLQRDAATPLARDQAWYRNRIFGPGAPNVASWFSAISKNRFTFSEASVLNVVDRTDAAFLERAGATGTVGTLQTRLRSLMLADDAGFPFENYDANDDGQVTTDELAVLTIDNYSEGSAQTGGTGCVDHPGGIDVCTMVSLAGHRSRIDNYAHELSHQFGTIDTYGASCHSFQQTLMSCTADGGSEGNAVYHIDPWHRERLGWTASGTVGGASGSLKLSPVSSITGPFGSPGQERLTFMRAGTNEQLVFEYRKRDGSYDQNVAREGITVWYVKTDAPSSPSNLASLTVPGGSDAAVFTLSPSACFGDPMLAASRGRSTLPYRADSKYRFRWGDGSDTGKLFTIGAVAADGTITISWSTSTAAPSCPEAVYQPDFVVESIGVGCSGPGFPPRVLVTVGNHGNWVGRGWVDLFVGLASPPTIGTFSDIFRMSPDIAPGGTTLMSFEVAASNQGLSRWVDVLLDTTTSVAESVETNNHGDQWVTFPDCSFG